MSSLSLSFFLLILFFPSTLVQATVSPSKTFKYVNEGEFGDYLTEHGADYRILPIVTYPFSICFYNTTPNAFILGLKMGTHHSESLMRWAWAANRGNPVGENATLTFSRDGNLVLADADGKIAWQTGTANKSVVGIKLLPNGNLVLHDKRGKFVWQSFDHPTDSLLVGQSLRSSGVNKIVSRVSDEDGSEGVYSYVFEQNRLALYKRTINSLNPLLYYASETFESVSQVTFYCESDTFNGSEPHAYTLGYGFASGDEPFGMSWTLARPKYNATLSLLRLGSDGNIRMYTYDTKVDWGAWEVTYSLFSREGGLSECKLPTRCGALGVCEDDQCVACPTAKGLLGWSRTCAPPKQGSCAGGVGKKASYYKVVGVEHFSISEGDGPLKVDQCKEKCDKDCSCLGFFYREESSKCLLATELGTLSKVDNPSHVGYIKMSEQFNLGRALSA